MFSARYLLFSVLKNKENVAEATNSAFCKAPFCN